MKSDNMKLELRIVDLLARNQEKGFTINEIAKELKQYYSFVNRIVNRLAEENILIAKKAGRAYLCSLNLNEEKTFALLSLAEIERKEEFYKKNKKLKLILEDFINSVRNNVRSIVLFGSYAKGISTEKSDIDLLLISKNKFPIEKIAREIYSKYGIEINTVVLTEMEFKNQRAKEIIREIIKNHYIAYGAEKFASLMFK